MVVTKLILSQRGFYLKQGLLWIFVQQQQHSWRTRNAVGGLILPLAVVSVFAGWPLDLGELVTIVLVSDILPVLTDGASHREAY